MITNALDYIDIDDQINYARYKYDFLTSFLEAGLSPSRLDLRYFFGRSDALRLYLRDFDIVWAVGGNSFLLRRAMRESGFDSIIHDMLSANEIIYGGWSAGAVFAAKSMRGIEHMDEPYQMAAGYSQKEPIWEGLNLVDFLIVPHFESDHPEAEAAALTASILTKEGVQFRTMRDGEVFAGSRDDLKLYARK